MIVITEIVWFKLYWKKKPNCSLDITSHGWRFWYVFNVKSIDKFYNKIPYVFPVWKK